MNILVVCQYYYPEPFRITDICESLVKSGHNVTVLTGLPNYPEGYILDDYRHGKKRNEIINGVKVIRCFEIGRGKSKLKLFLNYFSYTISATLKALFIKEEFDVILVNQLSPVMMGIPAIAYKKKHHKKMLLYCLDLWPDSLAAGGIKEDSIIYKIFYNISKWIYYSADTILVTSSMFKDYFKDVLEITNIEIKHLPQYAEDLFIQNENESSGYSAVQDDSKQYNFVFAGNIGDMQSVETIIKAANELRKYSNILFHIVGDGSKLDDCKQLANHLKLSNVIFYGRRPLDEMPEFYGMADAMLVTLKDNKILSYTLPGKVQTYMAAGKPIIGSINGETKRVIEQAGCGLCCKAEDYKGLADLILEFCNDDKKDNMAMNARKYYFENYSKERFMSILEHELTNMEA
ncbi:glycosyl transferase group 1 [Thermoanaerobacterium xylanolyticum LX-11]|uniref:Glycosyl transferase group 1 n=1 Tax=Thermoanaerobacterium xylanolyticum (strain ATCC 49914 / DSM 7097 / LX-11) TaxID=858215 RepID=F6BIU1_THEXL|nr:glycosyltransferase family 4 protein [Thermoanaerobacterium xylanolyticum]AEF17826.1 glycosyl transferase group 1 [Thermoanaerobacterium xylanolyticum LX-11]